MYDLWLQIISGGGATMKCNCYKLRFLPIIEFLESAASHMNFRTPGYDQHQQKIHEIVQEMNMRFKCIDRCYYGHLPV
jgi:hypothetical protein